NKIQLNICGMLPGSTALNIVCQYVAPVAFNASTESLLPSSIVSTKALTKNPNEPKNKARNPVIEFVPKLMTKINAQATTGILRDIEAIIFAASINDLLI